MFETLNWSTMQYIHKCGARVLHLTGNIDENPDQLIVENDKNNLKIDTAN